MPRFPCYLQTSHCGRTEAGMGWQWDAHSYIHLGERCHPGEAERLRQTQTCIPADRIGHGRERLQQNRWTVSLQDQKTEGQLPPVHWQLQVDTTTLTSKVEYLNLKMKYILSSQPIEMKGSRWSGSFSYSWRKYLRNTLLMMQKPPRLRSQRQLGEKTHTGLQQHRAQVNLNYEKCNFH